MSKKVMVTALLLLALFLAGCPGRGQVTPGEPVEPVEVRETVRLYYGDAGNERLVSEEREIIYRQGEDRFSVVLAALIRGPQTGGLTANIAPQTTVYGTIVQNDALLVNVSREFQQFGGSVAETVAVLSVVNTLTELNGIERVKILVEGEELIGPSGEPRGFIERYEEDVPPAPAVDTITLYFANENATALVPEERAVTFPAQTGQTEQLRVVLEELIRGPQQTGLFGTIPQEVRVLSVDVEDGLARVDFSAEMHTRHPGGAAGETMTILSIANTLTEFEGVGFVQMTVNGAPMNIEHVVLDQPVERNEALIERPAAQ